MATESPLEGLYPFLGERDRKAQDLDIALLESVASKAAQSREVSERFFGEQAPVLVAAAKALAETYRTGGRMFSMGNGGSSCDSAHLAVEFLHPVTTGRPALPAIDLVTDTAMLTAVGNDVGFDHVFARQVIAHGRRGDSLVGFSTSGNSPNLIAGFRAAREIGLATLGFAGGDGGEMARCGFVDHLLTVPTPSIHRVQENHVTAFHILWDLVHTLLADDRGGTILAGSEA